MLRESTYASFAACRQSELELLGDLEPAAKGLPQSRSGILGALLPALFLIACGLCAEQPAERTDERARMIAEIEADFADLARFTGLQRLAPEVRAALEAVPRHQLVGAAERPYAYLNRPLPIGEGQTISQPYIVALMTQLLEPEATDRILDIGTGSGYQAAVMAEIVSQVYSIEIVPSLAATATSRLAQLGYDNIDVRVGDGYFGWPEEAPFDGIIVAAATPEVPPALVEQLATGGRLVLPLDTGRAGQELVVVDKDSEGRVHQRHILAVRFVPLTGDH